MFFCPTVDCFLPQSPPTVKWNSTSFIIAWTLWRLCSPTQSRMMLWGHGTVSSADKVLPSPLDRHLTYFPQHLYMIIWYCHSFYTRWFELGVWLALFLGCVLCVPQKVIDKWLWRIFIGYAVTTLVSGFCCYPGSLHLDTALLVKWDTWHGSRAYCTADHMDWHICLTVCRLLLINSLATSVPDRWIKAAVNTFISVISSSLPPTPSLLVF